MSDTQSTISDIKLFIQRLKNELPEIFGQPAHSAQNTPTAGQILYRGDLYPARVHLTPDQPEGIEFDGQLFNVYIQTEQTSPSELLTQWLRNQAGEVLRQQTRQWADKMGVEYNQIFIKDQHTLWASCSSKKNINYSYRLLKMPEVIMNYLIVHELAHLMHMNHGPQYWEFVAQFCPQYKEHRKWLNDNKDAVFAEINISYTPQPAAPAQQDAAPSDLPAEPGAAKPQH